MDWLSNLAELAYDFTCDMRRNVRELFPFHGLWESSDDLNKRFGIEPINQDVLIIFGEEVREFTEAYVNAKMGVVKDYWRKEAIDEFADVLVCGFQVLRAIGVDDVADVVAGISRTIDKNDAKTHETHEFSPDTNKIRRKQP